jgi:signal transduction histidine kinase
MPNRAFAAIEDGFRRRVLASGAVVMGLAVFAGGIARNWIAPLPLDMIFLVIFTGGAFLLAPRLLLNRVPPMVTALVLLTILAAAATFGGIRNGGLHAPITSIYILLPILGYFAGGFRVALVGSLLGCLGILLLNLATRFDWVSPLEAPEHFDAYKSVVTFFEIAASFGLGAAYDRSRRRSEAFISELCARVAQGSKLSSLGEVSAGVAHEINNPLAILKIRLQRMQEDLSSGEIDRATLLAELQKADASADRISRIVKGLLAFARSSDNEPLAPTPLKRVVDSTLDLCSERFKKRSIALNVQCPIDVTVKCRAVQLEQVLLNLLTNAFDAVENLEEKWVSLDVWEGSGAILVNVTDSGKGIPPPVRERLMQPFFTTKGPGRGTGLGLSVSMGMIEGQGGRLYYDPDCANTKFVIELPLVQSTG